jgi:hypothetical protein
MKAQSSLFSVTTMRRGRVFGATPSVRMFACAIALLCAARSSSLFAVAINRRQINRDISSVLTDKRETGSIYDDVFYGERPLRTA